MVESPLGLEELDPGRDLGRGPAGLDRPSTEVGVIYGSICSGIEAATVAWEPLGWRPAFFSEIEAFPRAVLAHHYPDVPLHGDFTTIGADDYGSIDLLVGGTPCQSFSIAGLRKGLADSRGNLALEFLLLVKRRRPPWVVWENVPGVRSSNGGRDFGAFLGGLGELGYGWAYRSLDAQYFGLAQRRERVFVVGHSGGDWRRAGAVLFESSSLSGHPPPSRETRQDIAGTLASRAGGGGRPDGGDGRHSQLVPEVSYAVQAGGGGSKFGSGRHNQDTFIPIIAGTLNARKGQNGGASNDNLDAQHIIAIMDERVVTSPDNRATCDPSRPVPTMHEKPLAIAFAELADPIAAIQHMAVRRLTPRECERLQGFPDDYTRIPIRGKPAKDTPRYKALGNSMAVPVMRWIGERIAKVEALPWPD